MPQYKTITEALHSWQTNIFSPFMICPVDRLRWQSHWWRETVS